MYFVVTIDSAEHKQPAENHCHERQYNSDDERAGISGFIVLKLKEKISGKPRRD